MKIETLKEISNSKMVEPFEMEFTEDIKADLKWSLLVTFSDFIEEQENPEEYCLFGIKFEEDHVEIYGEHLSTKHKVKANIGYIIND